MGTLYKRHTGDRQKERERNEGLSEWGWQEIYVPLAKLKLARHVWDTCGLPLGMYVPLAKLELVPNEFVWENKAMW